MSDRQKMIDCLAEFVILAKKTYYSGKPVINDNDYDFIEHVLEKLDPNNKAVLMVGYDGSLD